jgi:hypothetical protein
MSRPPKILTRGCGSIAKRATELLFFIPKLLITNSPISQKSNSNALLPRLRTEKHRQNSDGILEPGTHIRCRAISSRH